MHAEVAADTSAPATLAPAVATTPPAPTVPTEPGTPFGGGFYVGRFRIGEQLFALIVSPKVQGEALGVCWSPGYTDEQAATSCCDGLANTRAMAAAGSTVAELILKLEIDDHTDWYLPSRDELELIYRHLKPTTQTNSCSFRDGDNPSSVPVGYPYTDESPLQTSAPEFAFGGSEAFASEWYWSSTQSSRHYAWVQHFGDGGQYGGAKVDQARVRAVRRFSL